MKVESHFSLYSLTQATVRFAALVFFALGMLLALGIAVAIYRGVPLQMGFIEAVPLARWVQMLLALIVLSMFAGLMICTFNWARERLTTR